MKIQKLGNRGQSPAFFDMSGRFRPGRAPWYGQGFRIGDRAAAYLYLKHWRQRYPARRLLIVEDNWIEGTEYSRWLPAKWLFPGIADEIWSTDSAKEVVKRPGGEPLYTDTLWTFWKSFARSERTVVPNLEPDTLASKRADTILQDFKVPADYVTIQPLFDATYDRHRNQTIGWWQSVIERIAGRVPTVVLGVPALSKQMKLPHNCYQIFVRGLDPMVSLALIRKAAMHVGGATGTTLWASMFRVPTVAVYNSWVSTGSTDVRPISFGKPVIYSPLSDIPEATATRITHVYAELKKEVAGAVSAIPG